MLRPWKSVFAVGGLLTALSGLAQPAQAQYVEPYPYPVAPAAPPVVAAAAPYPYLWGGRRYCWYANGWRGPGWYWCGYAFRTGFGWGGPVGWNGWAYRGGYWRGGWRGGYWRGGWHRGWR